MKILCLGNNTADSDQQSRDLAQGRGLAYHGLISDLDRPWCQQDIEASGVYHSTPVDCSYHRLLQLADACDAIVILDQPRDSMHADSWLLIHRVIQDSKTPCDNSMILHNIDYWQAILDTNPSFCILPWVEQMLGDANDGAAIKLCCRSDIRIDRPGYQPVSWQQDERYTSIRHSMLQGEKLPHCENCYQQQAQGLISDRHTETLEWTNRLGLRHIDDLTDLQAPAYIEVRPNNRCNLMCRMCNPHSSHRIAKEYKQLGLVRTVSSTPASDAFSGIDLAALKKLYVSGGEPLINPEFVQWLDQSRGQVSAQTEIMINTNGTRLPMRLRKLLPDWPNLQFIFSIDAFGSLNDYIRWPSSWHTILDHWRYLREAGHRVHVNTTVSIYNIHRLSELFEFIDQTWPDTLLHLNLVQDPDHISFQTFPDRDLAQKDLGRAQQCQVVKNNRLAGDTLRYLSKQMHLEHDRSHLERFFDFNDRLDQSRGTQLGFYDKILDSYRK